MPTKKQAKRSPPNWLELSIQVPFEYVEPAAELFRRYGKGGVSIEEAGGWNPDEGETGPPRPAAKVTTYMPLTPAFHSNRELVHIGIQLISHLTELPPLEEREVPEREWEEAWKAHFTPLRVGRRLVVHPPWHSASLGHDDIGIEVDPGMAFGTGRHPTTFRTLESLERLIMPGATALDVGTGSGILSIAAAKLGASAVVGVELDKIALRAARSNLRVNGVSGVARCYGGTLPNEHVPHAWASLVLANINSVALTNMAPHLRDALKPGGWLVAAGILEERREGVERAFAGAGLAIRETIRDDDWVVLLAQ